MKKRVLVTGASKGIGRAVCEKLVKEGHIVLGISRTESALREMAQQLKEEAGAFYPYAFDLCEGEYYLLKGIVASQLGGIDAVINNAGALVNKPFLEITRADLELVYETNVYSLFRLLQEIWPHLGAGSHVVNITSMGGITGSAKFPGLTAYSSSKGAVSILTEVLQAEFEESGIVCNGLALGSVQTEMLEAAFPGYKAPLSPAEMADFITWFALSGHQFFKGKVLPVSLTNP